MKVLAVFGARPEAEEIRYVYPVFLKYASPLPHVVTPILLLHGGEMRGEAG